MNKKSENNVHLHGFVNDIRINEEKGFVNVRLGTYEQFNKDGQAQKNYYSHDVAIKTDDPKVIQQFKDAKAKIDNGEKIMAVADGSLVNNKTVMVKPENFQLGVPRKDEVMNTASFKGNIANIDVRDGFASVTIGTHYYVPGESQIHTGETKPYTEMTSFVKTQVSEKHMPEVFGQLKSGEIKVGDLVEARGQLHNYSYTNEAGETKYGTNVDLNNFKVLAHKKAKEVKETEKTAKKAEVKKDAPAKKETAKKEAAPKKTAAKKAAAAVAPKKAVPVKRGPKIG